MYNMTMDNWKLSRVDFGFDFLNLKFILILISKKGKAVASIEKTSNSVYLCF